MSMAGQIAVHETLATTGFPFDPQSSHWQARVVGAGDQGWIGDWHAGLVRHPGFYFGAHRQGLQSPIDGRVDHGYLPMHRLVYRRLLMIRSNVAQFPCDLSQWWFFFVVGVGGSFGSHGRRIALNVAPAVVKDFCRR